MEMIPSLLPGAWQLAGWIGALALVTYGVRRVPWGWLRHQGHAQRFALATIAVLVVWQVRAVMPDGPTIHLLGATLLTLSFGPWLAGASLLVVLALATLEAGSGFGACGVNALLLVALPVAFSFAFARASEWWLPRHFFVYVFAAGFFGAALTAGFTALAACAVLVLAGRVPPDAVLDNYLPTSTLLLFPEAFLTGALITLAAVYRPDWLVSFRDRDYLDGR